MYKKNCHFLIFISRYFKVPICQGAWLQIKVFIDCLESPIHTNVEIYKYLILSFPVCQMCPPHKVHHAIP